MEDNNKVLDSLKRDSFVVDELFEDIFNGLSGVYLRLYYKESKSGSDRDRVKQGEFLKRFYEIGRLKSSYGLKDWENKRIAIDEYASELRKMLDLELRDYANIG